MVPEEGSHAWGIAYMLPDDLAIRQQALEVCVARPSLADSVTCTLTDRSQIASERAMHDQTIVSKRAGARVAGEAV